MAAMDGNRFTDDLHLVPPDQYQAVSVVEILRSEHLEDESRDEQAQAIRNWLSSHTPSPLMEYSIRKRGFGELLNDAD